MQPTVGLAVIARDEEDKLPYLLASVEGAFDQIALVDTGSDDRTVEVFREWCVSTGQDHTIDTFEWIDDFSAARNHAYGLLTTAWTCWADADDWIVGAHRLRRIAAAAPPTVAGYVADYDYRWEGRECVSTLRLPRLVWRHAGVVWVGRTHDSQIIDGVVAYTPRVRWVHLGSADLDASSERDRRIMERWHRNEADNPYVRAALDASDRAPELFDLLREIALTVELARVAEARGVWTDRYRRRLGVLREELTAAVAVDRVG